MVKKIGKALKKVKRVVKISKKVSRKSVKKSGERVATGVVNFDNLIEGGFEMDSTNLVAGGSGLGKTIFATQFLIEGMKRGEKCLYVTFEEKKEQFFENMIEFGWNLAEYEKKGLFTFLEYSPVKVKTMLEEGGGEIESIILRKKVSRIVIDSITSFELLFKDELEKREASLALFGMIRGWDCTSLLTLEESVQEGKLASRTLEFESDSIIFMYFTRVGNGRERRIEVIKMRGTKHTPYLYNFEIGKGGILLGKKPVSFRKGV